MKNNSIKQYQKELEKEADVYRERLQEMVNSYFKYTDIMPEEERNTGQLKFYEEKLLTRNIAVSTNQRVAFPQKKVYKHLNETIASCNREVIDFFDEEKNLEAFFDSPFVPDDLKKLKEIKGMEKIKLKEGPSKFLLLEKAQNEVEKQFVKDLAKALNDFL